MKHPPVMIARARAVTAALALAGMATWGGAVIAGTTDEVRAPRVDVTNGKVTFQGAGRTLQDLSGVLETKLDIRIRITDDAAARTPIPVAFADRPAKDAMQVILTPFNYSVVVDNSGRTTYLVTSLAAETRPVAEQKPAVAAAPAAAAPAKATAAARSSQLSSLDEFRAVRAAQIKDYQQQSADEIKADFAREREEKLVRSLDILKSPEAGELRQQALFDLAKYDDPRATAALREALQNPGVQRDASAGTVVARAVWQHAAQLQFADAETNQLLTSMSQSSNPGISTVGRDAVRDMTRYRAQNGR